MSPPCFVVYRRLAARYSLVAVALCVYTVWIHGYVASRYPRADDEIRSSRIGEELNADSAPSIQSDVHRYDSTAHHRLLAPFSSPTAAASAPALSMKTVAMTTNARQVFDQLSISELFRTKPQSLRRTPTPSVASSKSPYPEKLTVHITWFYPPRTEFRFHEAICLLAIQRFVRPRKILFWYDSASTLPVGPWWQFARQSVAHLLPVPIDRPKSVFNRTVAVPEHQSDLIRLDVLYRYGGLYVDLDVIVVRPIDDLIRIAADQSIVVMGAETPNMLGSGFILAPRPGVEFLALWHQSYADNFNDSDWNHHSVFIPMELARRRSDLVRIEWFSINRPNWNERRWLYTPDALWDWSLNYAVHLWYRDHPVGTAYDPVTIRGLNTTTGEVLRHIYYEQTDLLPAFIADSVAAEQTLSPLALEIDGRTTYSSRTRHHL